MRDVPPEKTVPAAREKPEKKRRESRRGAKPVNQNGSREAAFLGFLRALTIL
jgi:hypothetical protein